jgi:outer membrane protein
MPGATGRKSGRAERPRRQRARPPSLSAAVIACLCSGLVAGCSALSFSAAWDPYPAAPPAASTPWRPAEARKQPRLAALIDRLGGEVQIDPDRVYGLAELIDLAQRLNPETRRTWEEARASAARLGRAESAWFPVLAAVVAGGTQRVVERAPDDGFPVTGPALAPSLRLSWLLLDFGRRSATVEEASWRVVESNFAFNRKHQEVAYDVSRSFFAFDASRARVAAAGVTLEQASTVAEAVRARLEQGLATRPELLLALQDRARAAFEVQEALGIQADTQARLAESVGITPTMPLHVADLSALPLPTGLPDTVEQVIDGALGRRPDLAARLAALRAREAEIRRARAEFLPRVGLSGSVGGETGRFTFGSRGPFSYSEPVYSAFVSFEWALFEGFERENRLRETSSQRGAAAAEVQALELRVIRQVWQAYADVKTALQKREFALALLAAAEEAYAATLESYQVSGLATVLDLLAAQRDLARARSTEIQSRADLLQATAALVFAAGN